MVERRGPQRPDSSYLTARFDSEGETAWLAGRGRVKRMPVIRP
jgi:hypothetical protein